MTIRILSRATVACLVLAVLATPSTSNAQSQAELRRENQRLQTRVTELEAELEAARRRIGDLEQQIEQLRQAAAAAARGESPAVPPPPPPPPPVSIDESKPTASPRTLLRELDRRYREHFDGVAIGEGSDRDRIRYMKEVRDWVAQVNRELKTPIEWPVSLISYRRGSIAELQFTDPVTGTTLGSPFIVRLPPSAARRLWNLLERGEDDQLFELHAVLIPDVRMNPMRAEPGPFDNPTLIGPFAEFGYRVDARTLAPWREGQ